MLQVAQVVTIELERERLSTVQTERGKKLSVQMNIFHICYQQCSTKAKTLRKLYTRYTKIEFYCRMVLKYVLDSWFPLKVLV